MRPDELDRIIDRAMSKEVEGELDLDFALRIEREARAVHEEETDHHTWIWYAGMAIIALIFSLLHVRFAFSQYAAVWTDAVTMTATLRLDLLGVAAVVIAALESIGRRWASG